MRISKLSNARAISSVSQKDGLAAGVLTSPCLEVENESARKLEVVLRTVKKTRAHVVAFQAK